MTTSVISTGSHATRIVQAARESFVDGWQQAMRTGAAVMVVLSVYVAVRGPKKRVRSAADDAETGLRSSRVESAL